MNVKNCERNCSFEVRDLEVRWRRSDVGGAGCGDVYCSEVTQPPSFSLPSARSYRRSRTFPWRTNTGVSSGCRSAGTSPSGRTETTSRVFFTDAALSPRARVTVSGKTHKSGMSSRRVWKRAPTRASSTLPRLQL